MQKRRTGDEKLENTELYIKILAEYYAEHGELEREVDGTKIVQDQCYRALCRIKEILEDDSIEDPECFWRIEEIVMVLEGLGLDAGSRHDFG